MNITIERIHETPDSIDGVLKIADSKICDCAEYAPTALKAGTYPISITTCRHYRRKMPCILVGALHCADCPKMQSVTNNATLPTYCPQIKIGNGVHNRSDGSIIIGERIMWGAIKHPQQHFNRLIDRLDKAANRGESITLQIVDKTLKPFETF